MHIIKNVVYFLLDIRKRIDVIYNEDLKNFMATICNDGKLETMVKM